MGYRLTSFNFKDQCRPHPVKWPAQVFMRQLPRAGTTDFSHSSLHTFSVWVIGRHALSFAKFVVKRERT